MPGAPRDNIVIIAAPIGRLVFADAPPLCGARIMGEWHAASKSGDLGKLKFS
jgi:hypothetical protein